MGHLKKVFEPDPSPAKRPHNMYQNESDQAVLNFMGAAGTVALILLGLVSLGIYLAKRLMLG